MRSKAAWGHPGNQPFMTILIRQTGFDRSGRLGAFFGEFLSGGLARSQAVGRKPWAS